MNSHRLDGLDCSGYTSWVYNQITDNRNYDSGAAQFISSGGLRTIDYGSICYLEMYTLTGHIVLIVGKVANSGKSHIILEASPNTVKLVFCTIVV